MKKPEIYLLTGDIRTGKTTALQQWAVTQKEVYGIVSPLIGNERFFMNVDTKEVYKMEAEANEAAFLVVGRYVFSKLSFKFAMDTIRKAMYHTRGWLLIDECGPLELKTEGLYDAIKEVLALSHTELKIVMVVRQFILNEVIDFFGLDSKVINVVDKSFFTKGFE